MPTLEEQQRELARWKSLPPEEQDAELQAAMCKERLGKEGEHEGNCVGKSESHVPDFPDDFEDGVTFLRSRDYARAINSFRKARRRIGAI